MGIPADQLTERMRRMMPSSELARQDEGFTPPSVLIEKAERKHEREIQDDIARWLGLHDVDYIRPRMDRKSTIAEGWPDFTFCYGGKPFAIEIKTPEGRASVEQTATMARLAKQGWTVGIARSLPGFIALLKNKSDFTVDTRQ